MKRFFFTILTIIILSNPVGLANNSIDNSLMDDTWQSFRTNHPFGYQTVGLRHEGDYCIFVISEPTESVSKDAIGYLFKQYGGESVVKQKSFGYDGWLSDIVGQVKFINKTQEDRFKRDLFTLLYGTDYKAYYLDLDHPSQQVYYSPYKLNYSISAAELTSWFIENKELLKDESGIKKDIKGWLSSKFKESNKLLFSVDNGFVVWLIDTKKIKSNDKSFKTNARKFSLDTDLIIGAFGKKNGTVAVVAREREVPVTVLPPLRVETLTLLATTTNQNLAQSYERYNVFAGKLKGDKDFAPIYLSDELWHTEYGNLLNITDQMLKSWSQNGRIDYYDFDYPKPIDWAFQKGAMEDLEAKQLTYNWNTKGAGYIIEDDYYDVYAINRTGCLPVSYFPDAMEGRVEEKVYDAEELAYDFFSRLNNPELVRVVQYAAFYQILTYFKNESKTTRAVTKDNSVPDYSVFYGYVEKILRLVDDNNTDIYSSQMYQSGLIRFVNRYNEANDVSEMMQGYLKNDEYGEFESYLKEQLGEYGYRQLLYGAEKSEIEQVYRAYLDTNVAIVRAYIDNYKLQYGSFPYAEAASFIVSQREMAKEIESIESTKKQVTRVYDSLVSVWNNNLKELDEKSKMVYDKLNIFDYTPLMEDFSVDVRLFDTTLTSEERAAIMNEISQRAKTRASREKKSDDIYERVYNRLQKIDKNIKAHPYMMYSYGDEINNLITKWNNNEKIVERIVKLQPKIEKILEPYNKKEERLILLQAKDKQQKAIGALNWLLTDASPFDEPSGQFFSSRLTEHRQWTKSPSMTCSFNGSGYGGHNLDAHVTPIKTVKSLKSGECRVTFDNNGNRVVSVAKEDRKRITPEVLRHIERRVAENTTLDLSQFSRPVPRPRTAIVQQTERRSVRGFDASQIEERVSVNDAYQGNLNVFLEGRKEALASTGEGTEIIKSIPYTEREIIVEHDGHRYVFARDGKNLEFDFNNISEDIIVDESNSEYNTVTLVQKPESISNKDYSEIKLVIKLPKEISTKEFKEWVRTYSSNQKNRFSFDRYIELKLKNFNLEDIKRETQSTLRAHLFEFNLFYNDQLINDYFYYGDNAA